MFGLNDILGHFSLGRVWFGSGRVRANQFLVKYTRHAKTSNFMKNFGSGMVQFGSIRVSGSLSGEHISGVGSGMGLGRSVRISGPGSVLPGLSMMQFPNMPQDIIRLHFIPFALTDSVKSECRLSRHTPFPRGMGL